MYLLLLLVGLLMTAAGFVAIGFGIPINALASLGNTLIVSGTSLVSGGLVVVGLAVVVRQLQHLAAGFAAQPAKPPTRPSAASETMVPPTARLSPSPMTPSPPRSPETAPARSPEPRGPDLRTAEHRPPEPRPFALRPPEPRPSEPRPREPRSPEPRGSEARVPDAAPARLDPQGPLSWLRAKPRASDDDAPPIADVPADAPPPRRAPPQEGYLPPSERAEPPDRDDGAAPAQSELAPEPRKEDEIRAAPASERPKDTGLFDVAWPDRTSAAAASSETGKREPPRSAAPARARPEPAAERRAAAQPVPPERTPTILKSGVIDGMAYTLYADGSIEAELPQGTLSFASVDALRAHLEKHGG